MRHILSLDASRKHEKSAQYSHMHWKGLPFTLCKQQNKSVTQVLTLQFSWAGTIVKSGNETYIRSSSSRIQSAFCFFSLSLASSRHHFSYFYFLSLSSNCSNKTELQSRNLIKRVLTMSGFILDNAELVASVQQSSFNLPRLHRRVNAFLWEAAAALLSSLNGKFEN